MAILQPISRAKTKQIRILDITAADASAMLPPGHGISEIFFRERAGFAITGGFKIGTAAAGAQIVAAQAVTASAFGFVPSASILIRWNSATVQQQLFIDAVTSWNGARLDLYIVTNKLIP